MSGKPATKSAVAWKHIGLYGHSTGTFRAEPSGVLWKAATLQDGIVATTRSIPADILRKGGVAQWTVFGRSAHLRLTTTLAKKDAVTKTTQLRFDGFPPSDYMKLSSTLQEFYGLELNKHILSSSGYSYGKTDISGNHLMFRQCIVDEEGEDGEDGDEMFTIDLNEISQCVLPGNNKNEIELQFHDPDTVEQGTDQCVQMRIYVAPENRDDLDGGNPGGPTNAELLQQKIMTRAQIKNTAGNVIVEFDESNGTFLTPRGRYAIELFDTFLRMRGNKYNYKIKYDDISRLFLLPRADDIHAAFVIALDKPIRQGQQRYSYLVLQTNKNHSEINVKLDEESLKNEYNGDLQPIMSGRMDNLIAKTFKVITKKKVFIPGKFSNSMNQRCVKCAVSANEGHLYPLEKQFIFIHKPAVLIRFEEIESVEFLRYAGGLGSTRNFDLAVTLRGMSDNSRNKQGYTFSGIDRTDYTPLYNFLAGKKIKILNIQETSDAMGGSTNYNEQDMRPTAADDDVNEDESTDDDYGGSNASSSESDSDAGAESDGNVSEGTDEDLERARMEAKRNKNKEKMKVAAQKEKESEKKQRKISVSKSKKKTTDTDSDSDSDASEKKSSKKKLAAKGKKRSRDEVSVSSKSTTATKKSTKKKKKDPNAPKRAASAFTLYVKENRAKIKEQNPGLSFGDISRLVGQKFKQLSGEEKEKYEKIAAKEKERYKRQMENYKPPAADPDSPDDESNAGTKSDKKGKKKKDPNAPKRPLNAYTLYASEHRSKVKEANPDMSFPEITKLVAAQYKALSSEEKQKYLEEAKRRKSIYEKEMEIYNRNKKPGVSVQSSSTKKKKKKEKPLPSDTDDSDSSDVSSSSNGSDSSGDSDSDSD